MSLNEFNKKALIDTHKNANIALKSIDDIFPAVNDKRLKSELRRQKNGYESFLKRLNAFMLTSGVEPQGINPIGRAMLWTSIKMKTAFDESKNNIAEMMIKGTVTGINELAAMKNEGKKLEQGVLDFITELLTAEEENEKSLRNYL